MAGRWVSIRGKQWASLHDNISLPYTTPAGAGKAGVQLLVREILDAFPGPVSLTKLRLTGTVKAKAYVAPGAFAKLRYGPIEQSIMLVQNVAVPIIVPATDTGATTPFGLILSLEENSVETTDVEFRLTQCDIGDASGNWYNMLTRQWVSRNARRGVPMPWRLLAPSNKQRPGVVLTDSQILSVIAPGQKPTALRASGYVTVPLGVAGPEDQIDIRYGNAVAHSIPMLNGRTEFAFDSTPIDQTTVFDFNVTTEASETKFGDVNFNVQAIEIFVEDAPAPPIPPGETKAPYALFDYTGATTVPAGENHVLTFTDRSIPGSSAIVKWEWIFDEGMYIGQNPPPQAFYTNVPIDRVIVSLRVTDANGMQSTYGGTIGLNTTYPPPLPEPPPPTYVDPAPEPIQPAPPLPPKPSSDLDAQRETGSPVGVERYFGEPDVGLSKLGAVVVTKRALAGTRPIDPVRMAFYAVPLPYGMAYNYKTADKQVYVPIAIPSGGGAVQIPPGATPIYGPNGLPMGYFINQEGRVLIDGPEDFATWQQVNQSAGPNWFGVIPYMDIVHFPGIPTAPNGYPKPGHNGPIWGYFDLPTPGGMHREWRTYYRAAQGAMWQPMNYNSLPFCVTGGAANVTMLAGFPGTAGLPGVPATRVYDNREGWNAGANSNLQLDGNMRLTFNMNIQVAGAVGFARNRDDSTTLESLTHAVYVDRTNGVQRARALENGKVASMAVAYSPSDVFTMERIDGKVSYARNGDVFYRSRQTSSGTVFVGSALYTANDTVGE